MVAGSELDALIPRASNGDREAFGALWEAMHPGVVRYLRVLAGPIGEDLASETWVRAIRALPSFTGDAEGLRRWLVTIARRTYIDHVRTAQRRPDTWPTDPHDLAQDARGPAPDTADVAISSLEAPDAVALISDLPPHQAEAVWLRHVVGMDVAEVAAVTGRDAGAIRVATHRGLRTLAHRLRPDSEGARSVTSDTSEIPVPGGT